MMVADSQKSLVDDLKYPALLCDSATKKIVYKNSLFDSTFGLNVEMFPEWEQWAVDVCDCSNNNALPHHIGERSYIRHNNLAPCPQLASFRKKHVNIGAFCIIAFADTQVGDRPSIEVDELNKQKSLLQVSKDTPSAIYTMILESGNDKPRYTFLSDRLITMLNLDQKALFQDPEYGFSVIHPDDQKRWRDLAKDCIRGKSKFIGEVRVIVRGQEKWIRAEANPYNLSDGSVIWYGYVQDITEPFRIQTQLHETLLAAKAFNWRHDLTLGIITIDYPQRNDNVISIKTRKISIQQWMSLIRPDYLEFVTKNIEKLHSNNIEKYVLTYPVRPNENAPYQWVRVHGGAISHSENGRILATGGVGFNISDEVEKERSQKIIESNLREQLQKSFIGEAISHASSSVAHDLGNALSVIRWSIEACQESKGILEQVNDFYKSALDALDFAEQLRQNLQSSIRQNPNFSNFSYQLAIEKLRALSQPYIDSDSRIVINVQGDVPEFLYGNEVEFLQVIYNIFLNAVVSKVMDKPIDMLIDFEAVSSSWPTDLPLVGNSLKKASRSVKIKVSDTGRGISSTNLNKIFVQSHSTKGYHDRGFGLAIVSRIIRSYGGAIWCNSQINRGTSFTIAWPVEPQPMRGSTGEVSWTEHENNSNAYSIEDRKILLVDDNQDVALVMASMLEDVGARVTVETDSKVALTKLKDQRQKWDALVTDQDMPAIKGTELARSASNMDTRIPAIIVTANPYDTDLINCEYNVLKKPVSIMEFLLALSAAMSSNS